MLFPIKDERTMLIEMIQDLEDKTGINDFSPGSIALSLLEVFNKKLGTAYKDFDLFASKVFLSRADGPYLDLIGEMHHCKRNISETDSNYRYRIANQVFTAARSNETALRLQCLQIPKVKDIIMTRFTRGSGSFTIHVITDEVDTPDSVLAAVEEVVRKNKAEGISSIVTKPKALPLDLGFSIQLSKNSSETTTSLSNQIKTDIQKYIDSIGMGAPIPVQKIISVAASNVNVDKLYLSTFKISGEDIIIKDAYILEWDERVYVDSVNILMI